MFANNNLTAVNFAFPDVCKTPVPLPFPNLAMTVAHVPSVLNIVLTVGLAENLLTQGTVSMGDQPGALGGVASQTFMGPDRYIMGSFKVFFGVAPATRMTSVTLQNTSNMVGITMTPAQITVMVLA